MESTDSKLYYAGIGSRSTPRVILALMEEIAKKLAAKGFVLRSGGAAGADSAFSRGCDYWYHFSGDAVEGSPLPKEIFTMHDVKDDVTSLKAIEIAANLHARWDLVRPNPRKLHARNTFQVLGRDLETPVSIVICWTPDGCVRHETRSINTGGTGTAISIASTHNIPVLNLRHQKHIDLVRERLGI